jgi:hypothetical protein
MYGFGYFEKYTLISYVNTFLLLILLEKMLEL